MIVKGLLKLELQPIVLYVVVLIVIVRALEWSPFLSLSWSKSSPSWSGSLSGLGQASLGGQVLDSMASWAVFMKSSRSLLNFDLNSWGFELRCFLRHWDESSSDEEKESEEEDFLRLCLCLAFLCLRLAFLCLRLAFLFLGCFGGGEVSESLKWEEEEELEGNGLLDFNWLGGAEDGGTVPDMLDCWSFVLRLCCTSSSSPWVVCEESGSEWENPEISCWMIMGENPGKEGVIVIFCEAGVFWMDRVFNLQLVGRGSKCLAEGLKTSFNLANRSAMAAGSFFVAAAEESTFLIDLILSLRRSLLALSPCLYRSMMSVQITHSEGSYSYPLKHVALWVLQVLWGSFAEIFLPHFVQVFLLDGLKKNDYL